MRGYIPWEDLENEICECVCDTKGPHRRERKTVMKVCREVYAEVRDLKHTLETATRYADPEVTKAKWRTAIENRMRDGKESTYKIDPLTIWVIGMILELAFRWWMSRREAK